MHKELIKLFRAADPKVTSPRFRYFELMHQTPLPLVRTQAELYAKIAELNRSEIKEVIAIP